VVLAVVVFVPLELLQQPVLVPLLVLVLLQHVRRL
jgi:hypothetical protein